MDSRWSGKRWSRSLSALFMSGALAGACSDSSSQKLAAAALSEGCVINTDCEQPLVCAFRKCHNECESSRDCAEGQRCVASDRPFRVCQLEEERACVRNSQCPAPMVCGVDGECRDQCASDRDCVIGQQCVGGTCAEPEELDSEGELPVSPEAAPDLDTGGKPCLYTSDCADGLVCRLGQCVAECRTDVDCPRGTRCEVGTPSRCVSDAPVGDAGPDCVYNSDCPAGEFCVGGVCRCQCRSDVDCGLGSTCDGCACSAVTGTGGSGGVGGGGGAAGAATGGGAGAGALAGAGGTGGTGGGPDASAGCFYNSDCSGGGEVCVGGQCRCQCRADVDCAVGQVCNGCACVVDAPDGAPPDFGTSCNLNSDCVPPLVCLNGRCAYECQVDTDCGTQLGVCCFDNRCVTGQVCLPPVDGGTGGTGGTGGDAGCQACVSNFDCADGVWCNGIERCFAGCCAPAVDTPCNSNSSCIQDICDEQNQSCGQVVIAGEDVDGDGHLAFGCENGDDCDDSDPEVFTGAAEVCDGKDNDCNGLVDDRSRGAYGASFTLGSAGGIALGAPISGGWGFLARRLRCCPQDHIQAASTDDQGVLVQNWTTMIGVTPDGSNFVRDVSGGGGTVLAMYEEGDGTNKALKALLVDDSMGAVIQQVPLTSLASNSIFGDLDSTWTGTEYFVGWVGDGVATTGNVGTIGATGSLNGALVPTGAAGSVVMATRIRVSSNAATRGALYQLTDGRLAVGVFSASLSTLAGPVPLPADPAQNPQIIAIGGTVGGHVAVWADDLAGVKATFISDSGAVGKTVDVLGGVPIDGDGATDGDGAMFAFDYGSRASFGYAKGAIDNPFEVSNAITTGQSGGSAVNLATDGTRFGLFLWVGAANQTRWVPVGCAPPPATGVGDAGTD